MYSETHVTNSGLLPVSDLHSIYWEESGNPEGMPAVYLHGGPGGGSNSSMRRFFNPNKYRIILFDQRGCGKSKPHACTEQNTTWDLVDDIEKLRQHLQIDRWLVCGGSWGSLLSLAYAQSYPQSVSHLILRGIFMSRPEEINWLYQHGASQIYPEAWQNFLKPIQEILDKSPQTHPVKAFNHLLFNASLEQQIIAARAWSVWEQGLVQLNKSHADFPNAVPDKFALAFARIENHFFSHQCWLKSESHLLDNIDKIRHIPAAIVQGRYDMCTPVKTAWDLHLAWPEAAFTLTLAGHSASEEETANAITIATDRFSI